MALRSRAATLATQADALLRKNGRYQMTNWCAPARIWLCANAATLSLCVDACAHAFLRQENQLLFGADAPRLLHRAGRCAAAAPQPRLRARRTRAHTHASALLRCTAAAAPVLNFVVNDVLFSQPNLQCGCRCRALTTPDGNFTFDLATVRAPQTCVMGSSAPC
jgi:hypothetical protein